MKAIIGSGIILLLVFSVCANADVSEALVNRKTRPLYSDGLYEVYNQTKVVRRFGDIGPKGEDLDDMEVYAPCEKGDILVTGGCRLLGAGLDGVISINIPDLYSPAPGEGRFGLGLGWVCRATLKNKSATEDTLLSAQALCKKK